LNNQERKNEMREVKNIRMIGVVTAIGAVLSFAAASTAAVDLSVDQFSVDRMTVSPGQQLRVTWRVRRSGSSSASNFYHGIYWSTNGTISTSDRRLRENGRTSLSSRGTSIASTTTVTVPTDARAGRTYYVGYLVDSSRRISETSERNNTRRVAVRIGRSASSSSSWREVNIGPWTVNYGNRWNRSGTITVPGATRVKVFFSPIRIERNFDHLRTNASPANDWSGAYGNTWSGEKAGATITLRMTSDRSVIGRFTVTKVAYQGTKTGSVRRSGSLWATTSNLPPQRVSDPTFSPGPGRYNDAVRVSISCGTPGATICYTTNGSTPTSPSTVYRNPVTISAPTTLRARAYKAGMVDSNLRSGVYTIIPSVSSGSSNGSLGDRYERDDSPARAEIINSGQRQKRSIHSIGNVDWAKFTLRQLSEVRIETNGSGRYDTQMWLYGPNSSTRQVEYDDDDGTGYYSLINRTGSNALAAGTYYIKITEYGNNGTIPAYTLALHTTSAQQEQPEQRQERQQERQQEQQLEQQQVATPILTPRSGTYSGSIRATARCATSGATIRYTTDGSNPTSRSNLYRGPITIARTMTLKARAFRTGMVSSDVVTETYTIRISNAPAGDRYERDDTPAQAKTISSGQTQNRSVHVAGNADWVKFTLRQRSEVRIETNGSGRYDTVMILLGPNSSCRFVMRDDVGGSGRYSLINQTGSDALAPGTYYIKVTEYGNNGTIPAYTLALRVTPASGSRGVVLRYDRKPIPGATILFTNGRTTRTDSNGQFNILGTVKKITKNHSGRSHWVFRSIDSSGRRFEGAYLKNVICQQGGASVWNLAHVLDLGAPGLGVLAKGALSSLVDVSVGVKAIQDKDDIRRETADGRSGYMTGWTQVYVSGRLGGNLDFASMLLGVSGSVSTATMDTLHPDHDPTFDWARIDFKAVSLDNVLNKDISLSSALSRSGYRSGRIRGNAGLSTTVLGVTAIGGTVTFGGRRPMEYKAIGGGNGTSLGTMVLRESLQTPTVGIFGSIADRIATRAGLWRPATGTSETENNNWTPIP